MSQEHQSTREMWEQYLTSIGENTATTSKTYSAWCFCDNEKDANELAQLVIHGVKRATASLYVVYEFEKEKPPQAGDYSVITNWDGVAQCVIRTETVTLVPYAEVSEEFVAREGEGDRSLRHWREVHWDFFSREMKALGKEPSHDMLVVCEEFTVVFQDSKRKTEHTGEGDRRDSLTITLPA